MWGLKKNTRGNGSHKQSLEQDIIFIEGNCHTSVTVIEEKTKKIRKIKQRIFGKHASAKVPWNTEQKQGWWKGLLCFQMEKHNRSIQQAEENVRNGSSKSWNTEGKGTQLLNYCYYQVTGLQNKRKFLLTFLECLG